VSSKIAVITGGANGIGRVLVQSFARSGYKTWFLDLDEDTGDWVAGKTGAHFVPCDLSNPAELKRAADRVAKEARTIQVLVNNAGIGDSGTLATRELSSWNKVLAVNLTAPYLMTRALLGRFARGASIVNIASTRALMSEPDTEPYSASKGGVLALTHSLALSLQGKGIRVNAVSPGWIEVSQLHGRNGKPIRLKKRDHQQHPAGRVGKPEDIAQACLFLADPEKSGFITGANFVVDGGMTRKMIYVE
jgi:NAD(P)-dependent dehydrogenase (short-subunit alcohol dehydrogenase family)